MTSPDHPRRPDTVSPSRRLLVLWSATWLCVALIGYLSLIPRQMEVRTLLQPGVEHAIAYAGTAALMVSAFPGYPLWLVVGALFAYSGSMELLQTFSPGRHPGLDGVLWSSAGACVGAWSIVLTNRLAPALTRISRAPPN